MGSKTLVTAWIKSSKRIRKSALEVFTKKEIEEYKNRAILDAQGNKMYVDDCVRILANPPILGERQSIRIGRKYKIIFDENGELCLENKSYKEKWNDRLSSDWYLGSACIKI